MDKITGKGIGNVLILIGLMGLTLITLGLFISFMFTVFESDPTFVYVVFAMVAFIFAGICLLRGNKKHDRSQEGKRQNQLRFGQKRNSDG